MRSILLFTTAFAALISAQAFAQTADIDSMIDKLAPAEAAQPAPSAVLTVKSATLGAMVDRLSAASTRAVGDSAVALRLPSPSRGHEAEILRAIASRPSLQVAVNFQGGSDALAADATDFLGTMASALNDPRLAGQSFLIGVHTDLVGSEDYNFSVAELRAKAIAGVLTQQFGVAPARLATVGFGPLQNGAQAGSQIRLVNLGPTVAPPAPKPVVAAPAAPLVKPAPPRAHIAALPPKPPVKPAFAPAAPAAKAVERPRPRIAVVTPVAPKGYHAPRYHPPRARARYEYDDAADGPVARQPTRGGDPASLDGGSYLSVVRGGAGAGGAGGGGAGGGGAGGGGAGGAGGAGWSDRRLKRDIQRIGATSDGLPLYRFTYVWGGPEYVGVMAQDLIGLRPDAVIVDESGYLRVDYDRLGFALMTYEDYRALEMAE